MDPLSALGLASNIVQFVDFTCKLISTSREIQASQFGTKVEYMELQSITRNIQQLAGLACPKYSPYSKTKSKNDEILRELSSQCQVVSEELLSVLESLSVRGMEQERWESFYQALRSEWHKEYIEDLQLRLDRISHQLSTRVLLNQQSDVISKLQELAVDNRHLEVNRAREIDDLRKNFMLLFEQLYTEMREGGAKNRALVQLSLAADKGKEYAAEQFILEHISFDAMDDRQIAVRPAHEQTFSWIFNNTSPQNQPQGSSYFVEWLKSDETLFWISGKPGAGKSTLMKYLCGHSNTISNLKIWAKGHKLMTASFFFWNAGRVPLQKSQDGLLRSIMYQILRQSPQLIPQASPSQWEACIRGGKSRGASGLENLTTKELLAAFQRISKKLAFSDVRYCFFIDGLDEYEGKPNDIIRLVQVLKESLQVKVCVSSRPWNEFEKAFGHVDSRKLYIQDLTRNDIENYVRDVLEKDVGFQELKQRDDRCLELVQDIVDAAKGVFLWVFLVVRSLLEGLTNADRIVDLQRRVQELPTDLNEYFESILFTVDNFYRKQTARMFQVTLMAHDALPLMSYWFMDQEDPTLLQKLPVQPLSMEITLVRLSQMHKRLNACCKGLLETQSFGQSGPNSISGSVTDGGLFYLKVDFLHRTVRDFLRIPEMLSMLEKWAGTDFDIDVVICEAILAQVKTTPQEATHFRHMGPLSSLVGTFFSHVKMLEDSLRSDSAEVRLLDQLDETLKALKSTVVCPEAVLLSSCRAERDSWNAPEVSVLEEAVQRGLHHYVSEKLAGHPKNSAEMQSALLLAALRPIWRSETQDHRLKMVSWLLDKGFNANGRYYRGSVWTEFLSGELGEMQQGCIKDFDVTYSIIKAMLKHGADVNDSVILENGLKQSATEVITMLVMGDDLRDLDEFLAKASNAQDEGETGTPTHSRRKRFVKMIFGGKLGKRKS